MNTCCRLISHILLYNIKKNNKAVIEVPLGLPPETYKNQSTVSTAKRLALPRQLILCIILSMAMKLHVYGTRGTMYMYV